MELFSIRIQRTFQLVSTYKNKEIFLLLRNQSNILPFYKVCMIRLFASSMIEVSNEAK